jgi:hypothetical protein
MGGRRSRLGINEVLQGVVAVLGAQFPQAAVTLEEGEQPAGSFFVRVAGGSQERLLNRSQRRMYQLAIRYVGETYEERNTAAEQLYDALRAIAVQEHVWKAAAMSHETVDGVMHFTVQYPVRVVEELPAGNRMQTLEQKGVVK